MIGSFINGLWVPLTPLLRDLTLLNPIQSLYTKRILKISLKLKIGNCIIQANKVRSITACVCEIKVFLFVPYYIIST